MKKSVCSWKNCNTEINIDNSFEQSDVGMKLGVVVSGWCKSHSQLYNAQCDLFESLIPEWNKKQVKNKIGKTVKFTHHSDLSNYLYQYDKKEYNKITKKASQSFTGGIKN